VATFSPELKDVFRDLNLAWIKAYFAVEAKDSEQLNNPEECIKTGGQIFFVSDGPEVVGTCALYQINATQFELAKMAIDPSHQGSGFGDLLVLAAERWAKSQVANQFVILSNTKLIPAIALYHKHGFKTIRLGANPEYARADIELRKLF
jgi:putative acetyltransferase